MHDSCPLPLEPAADEQTTIIRMLQAKRIAIVGLSEDPWRPSHAIAVYLQNHGYEIVPVNPKYPTVLGHKSYRSLKDVPGKVDLVNVFRRPLACADVTRDAISIGAKGVWLQSGIVNAEAERLAREAGIDYVQDRCIMVEHQALTRSRRV